MDDIGSSYLSNLNENYLTVLCYYYYFKSIIGSFGWFVALWNDPKHEYIVSVSGEGFGFLLNSGIEYAFIFVCICVDSYYLLYTDCYFELNLQFCLYLAVYVD